MMRVGFTTNKTVEVVCKDIENIIVSVLGTKPVKRNIDKAIYYYPARRYAGMDDNMDDVRIIIRKVNNSTTSIKLENSEWMKNSPYGGSWRCPVLTKVYDIMTNALQSYYGTK